MTVQLLQVRTSPVTPVNSTAGPSACEGGTQVSEQCIARGVLQPDALLDEETREWSSRLSLGKEVPLFDAKGVRLDDHAGQNKAESSQQHQSNMTNTSQIAESNSSKPTVRQHAARELAIMQALADVSLIALRDRSKE
ncbi:hypothetical protein ABBQ38_007193 [Trebouxia sp. C0009 RCD-2024]